MQEVWKPVPGYEGRYEVSDQGRARSLDRVVTQISRWGTPYTSNRKGRVLRPGPSNFGHMSVVLGRRNTKMVHDLVLRAFIGPPPDMHECCHNNGDPADNRLENLRWGTRGENNIDAVLHQRRGKLTEAQVKDIRARVDMEGRGVGRRLAAEYGVHETTISAIKARRHYDYFMD